MTGESAGMFEAIYPGVETGGSTPPWDYGASRPQLVEWANARNLAGAGREALVVGSGYGADAEFLALLGCTLEGPVDSALRVTRVVVGVSGRWRVARVVVVVG